MFIRPQVKEHSWLVDRARQDRTAPVRRWATTRHLWVSLLLVLVGFTTTACSEPQTTGLLAQFPELVFNGRVVSEAGMGIPSEVVLTQRWYGLMDDGQTGDCSPNNHGADFVTQSDGDGLFRFVYYPSSGVDGCFVLRAYIPPDTLPLDSLILTIQDLVERGDPVTPERITVEVEIVVR